MDRIRKYAVSGFLAILACIACIGCEEEETVSVLPTFSGFQITPSAPEKGQTVRIEAVQSQIGKLLYRADYKWTLTKSDGTVKEVTKRVVYDNEPANPFFTYDIADNDPVGTYTVSFSGEYQYSATGGATVSGGNYSEGTSTKTGTITVRNSGALYGTCAGNVTFQVRVKSAPEE